MPTAPPDVNGWGDDRGGYNPPAKQQSFDGWDDDFDDDNDDDDRSSNSTTGQPQHQQVKLSLITRKSDFTVFLPVESIQFV